MEESGEVTSTITEITTQTEIPLLGNQKKNVEENVLLFTIYNITSEEDKLLTKMELFTKPLNGLTQEDNMFQESTLEFGETLEELVSLPHPKDLAQLMLGMQILNTHLEILLNTTESIGNTEHGLQLLEVYQVKLSGEFGLSIHGVMPNQTVAPEM